MQRDPTAYYALAAQVLPVLALIVIFELRVFGNWEEYWSRGGNPEDARRIPPIAALVTIFYGALFLFGELAALSAVRDGEPSTWDEAVVPAAITLYLVTVVSYPLQMHFEALLERTPLRRLRLYRRAAARRASAHGTPEGTRGTAEPPNRPPSHPRPRA